MIIEKFGIYDARNTSNDIRLDIQQKYEALSETSGLLVNLDFINHVSCAHQMLYEMIVKN